MDARLSQTAFSQRDAAAQTVASALVPRNSATTAKSAASTAATGTSPTTAAASPSDITSSDFLTLLVGELKNQDPTQPTDPNEYITQLAQVNSLEQLIQINSGISTLDSAVPATTTASSTGATTGNSASAQADSGQTTSSGAVIGVSPTTNLQPASAPATASEIHWKHAGVAGF